MLIVDDSWAVEAAAKALFEHIVKDTMPRLDNKHLWENSDEATRAGFRTEVRIVLRAYDLANNSV